MDPKARDSYLRNPPDSRLFSRRIARIRQKGFHAEARPGEGNELDAVAVYKVSPGSNPIIGDRPWGDGTPNWVRDATPNDSDKSFPVPVGKAWDLRYIYGYLAASAVVGNRQLRALISNAQGLDLYATMTTANIAANGNGAVTAIVGQTYNTAAYKQRAGAPQNNSGVVANDILPPCILTAGFTVRVWDVAAIDAAADDLTVVLHYVEYDA